MRRFKIPGKAIRRMAGYYRVLKDMEKAGEKLVLSSQLGRALNCAASQVRQDISFFGCFGTMGSGYSLSQLKKEICRILGADRQLPTIVIGMGHMGTHMLENSIFAQCGFNVVAAFDISPAVIGRNVNGIIVRDVEKLDEYLAENQVVMAAFCLPIYAAQAQADMLYHRGITAIWDISGCGLSNPGETILEELSLSDSFLVLSYQLSQRRRQAEQRKAEEKQETIRQVSAEHRSRDRGGQFERQSAFY